MFGLVKKLFIVLLTGIVNGSNHTKYLALTNQKCTTQPTLINLYPNNTVRNFPNKTEYLNLRVLIWRYDDAEPAKRGGGEDKTSMQRDTGEAFGIIQGAKQNDWPVIIHSKGSSSSPSSVQSLTAPANPKDDLKSFSRRKFESIKTGNEWATLVDTKF